MTVIVQITTQQAHTDSLQQQLTQLTATHESAENQLTDARALISELQARVTFLTIAFVIFKATHTRTHVCFNTYASDLSQLAVVYNKSPTKPKVEIVFAGLMHFLSCNQQCFSTESKII